jgi:ATP phosphoribosyltransferase
MKKLRMVVPKGRINENVVKLLSEAGVRLHVDERGYRPAVSDPEIEVKLMKPQNIPKLVELGSHDVGFSGLDWIIETGADVEELMDLEFNPVKIVAAIPEHEQPEKLLRRKIVVASEYENLSRKFLNERGFEYVFLRTFGATEVFPPDDADMIIENTETGRTLAEHNLKIMTKILDSSTRFIANKTALTDEWKCKKMYDLKMIFQAILDARARVMLEMNVPSEKLEEIIQILPCMRAPTVAPLYGEQGYAVKTAVHKHEVTKLLPLLKKMGATDILEYEFRKVVI